MDKLLVTIPEAAERLGVGRTSMYGLLDAGALPTVNIGRRRLVPVADLEAYVAKLRSGAA